MSMPFRVGEAYTPYQQTGPNQFTGAGIRWPKYHGASVTRRPAFAGTVASSRPRLVRFGS